MTDGKPIGKITDGKPIELETDYYDEEVPPAQIEEWGPRCIDEFGKFWGDILLPDEKKSLDVIWKEKQTCPDDEEVTLYHKAVRILHFAWCRDMAKRGYTKCSLRSPDFDEMSTAPYGISEARGEEE